jgi:YidC/Oxa1 family membrane protein insertase
MKEFFFTILYQPLYNFLILIAWLLPGHSIALSIIILTIIIRLILLPSSFKAAKLQVKNLEIQPKINKIRAEIKDQKEQSQALMDLYKNEGVSPFGSCLPLLIQLPILIVLYQVFRSGLTVDSFSDLYSFMPRPETLNTLFFGLDMTKSDPWILPIIAGLLQLGLSFLTMPPKPKTEETKSDPMAMMSRQMLFLLPITTVLFGRAMPSALVIYWIVTTAFSLVQQWYVNRMIKEEKERLAEKEPATSTISTKEEKALIADSTSAKEDKKKNLMFNIMNKRLEKQEKKSGVNVTVRTKKRS